MAAPVGYVAVSGVEHEPEAKPQMANEPHAVGVVAVPHVVVPPPPHNMVHRGERLLFSFSLQFFFVFFFFGVRGEGRCVLSSARPSLT